MTFSTKFSSPVGSLTLEGDDQSLTRLGFGEPVSAQGDAAAVGRAAIQLEQYFAGERTEFDLPLSEHGTPFERAVWAKLREIPYGETRCYGDIAKELGSVARAVGRANGRNQISIIVPCHRVIGADGSLTGFGGGLPTKQFLLELEGALPRADLFAVA